MRRKTVKDYINDLFKERLSEEDLKVILKVKDLYKKWRSTLSFHDFIKFLNVLELNRKFIRNRIGGFPQSYGRLRAIAFEEYIYYYLRKLTSESRNLRILWDEKIPIKAPVNYTLRPDFTILRDKEPIFFIEAKIEIDSQRIKSTLLDFILLKMNYPKALNVLIYYLLDGDEKLIELASRISLNFILDASSDYKSKFGSFEEWFLNIIRRQLQEGQR